MISGEQEKPARWGGEVMTVKRISVLDLESTACLHDHIISWAGDRSTEALSTLVRSFFQFASEIDEGEVSKVKFSCTNESKPSRHNRSRSRTGPVLGTSRKATGQEEMYLHCLRGTNGLIVAFLQYSSTEDVDQMLRDFLQALNESHVRSISEGIDLRQTVNECISRFFGVSEEETRFSIA